MSTLRYNQKSSIVVKNSYPCTLFKIYLIFVTLNVVICIKHNRLSSSSGVCIAISNIVYTYTCWSYQTFQQYVGQYIYIYLPLDILADFRVIRQYKGTVDSLVTYLTLYLPPDIRNVRQSNRISNNLSTYRFSMYPTV